MRYEVNHGRILTWALETHVVDHCNLRCVHCCTLSPHLAPWCVTPGDLAKDLAALARVLRPQVLKITGGEPLLHPDLLEILRIARASRIADTLSLTTNGLLLPQQPAAFFASIDRLTVSLYPSAPLPAAHLALIQARAATHGVALTLKDCARFQRLTPERAPGDLETAHDIYDRCWLKTRCHLIYRGCFYVCTRPPHLLQVQRLSDPDAEDLSASDGVPLDSPRLFARLRERLEDDDPLHACRYCLGANGAFEDHRQADYGNRTDL
ncbi:MAG: radical SAM protein [Vicinamibacteria bacterium]|jgi:hypothetical protein|nr:radical SAM protein [Vicinamibacteria bacterium]